MGRKEKEDNGCVQEAELTESLAGEGKGQGQGPFVVSFLGV